MTHIHLPAYLLSEWINGNNSEFYYAILGFPLQHWTDIPDWINNLPDAFRNIFDVGIAVTGGLFGDVTLEVVGMVEAINDAVQAIIDAINHLRTADWLRSIVEEQYAGDGWTWRGPITTYTDAFGVSRQGADPTLAGSWSNQYYWNKYMSLVDWYDVVCWQQTWGAQGIFWPYAQNWTISYWDHLSVTYPTNMFGQ
jgi:hypothetical protein